MQNCDIELDHDINKGINIKQVALETIEQNFYKINLYDVDKNKVVERIELSQFGLIDVSFKDNAIFYSNVNLKLEYLNLSQQNQAIEYSKLLLEKSTILRTRLTIRI
jgi:hypothetical protein